MSIVLTQADEIKIKTIQIVSKSHKNNDRNVVKVFFVSLLYVRIENCMLDCYFCALTQLVFFLFNFWCLFSASIAKHTPLFPRQKFIFILCVVNAHSFCWNRWKGKEKNQGSSNNRREYENLLMSHFFSFILLLW